ncbi:hypothetical protein ACRC7T_08875 [Segnochrobactraceae bacterium EtOH-i3]
MKAVVHNIRKNTNLKTALNNELIYNAVGDKVTISGWVYDPNGKIEIVAVKSNDTIFSTKINIFRQDVLKHLQKSGYTEHLARPQGYRFDFLYSDGMEIGYGDSKSIQWIYKLKRNESTVFEEYNSLEELLNSEEGVFRNIYFHNAPDWTKLIILFNGVLTPDKIATEKAVFQRWSWAKEFRHPVISIADPITIDRDPIVLGWYLGATGSNALPSLLRPVIQAARQKHPHVRTIGFGSSGGGFAALGAVLHGLIDDAIAINPQTNALKFQPKSAVDDFLRKRKHTPCESNLCEYDFSNLNPSSKIYYIQNTHDLHHYDVHYLPFRAVCESSGYLDQFSFVEYEDKKAGHMPPNMDGISKLLGYPFSSLLLKS